MYFILFLLLFFFKFRLPILALQWTTTMTVGGPRELLPNLVTLTVEHSQVDIQFIRYLRARSSLKNLSLPETYFGYVQLHPFLPPPPPRRNVGAVLRVLDISGIDPYLTTLVNEWLLRDVECKVTHLYMEDCHYLPHPVPAHLKIECMSVAKYSPLNERWDRIPGFRRIQDIRPWAAISTMREMNVSGCYLNEMERNDLVLRYPNVIFNLNEVFQPSVRVEL